LPSRAGAPSAKQAVRWSSTLQPSKGASPSPPADQAIYAELSFLHGRTADMVDAEVDGLKVMELLRRHPVQGADGAIIRTGGHVQLATVTKAGITTRILRRWPDAVAEAEPRRGGVLDVRVDPKAFV
jgi:hypothetical protein